MQSIAYGRTVSVTRLAKVHILIFQRIHRGIRKYFFLPRCRPASDPSVDLALAWAAMLWFDTTIFVLTLVQALRMRRRFPGALLELMFRDGEHLLSSGCATPSTHASITLIPSGTVYYGWVAPLLQGPYAHMQ